MERTNVTDKGYTYNGQNYVNQTKVDSQGNNYTVALPSTIPATSLTIPQGSIAVTQPQYNVNGQQAQAAQAGAYTNGASQTAEQNLAQQVEAQKNALAASNSDYSNLLTQAGGKGTDLATQYNQQDATGQSVNSLAGKLRSLNAQSMALGLDNQAKTQREINNATGQNITQAAVTRNTADATRENLINQASIAMQSAIVNADYQTAKSYADQIVDAKYDKIKAETAAKLFNLENIKESLTAAEKKVAEATTARLKKEEKEDEEKKANEKQVSDLIINASSQGAPQALRDKAAKAKTPLEAANILGEYAGDYLKNEKLRAEISRIAADTREQNLKNAALGVPANVQNKIAANINAGKIFSGQIVSKATGDIPKNISQDKVDGLLALKDLTKKVSDYSALYEQMGGAGLYQGLKSKVLPSSIQSQMDGLRSEIVDLLARARSGAALTAYETEQYENKLPGTFNTTLGLGTQGTEKLKSLSSSLNGTLDTKLNGYGVTFATTPEEDYLDAVEKANSSINTSQSQVSSYTQSLMTP